MFDSEITIGLLAWVFALLINRLLAERALRELTSEQKASLLDSFSSFRTYGKIAVAVLLIVFIGAIQILPALRLEFLWIFLAVVFLSQIARLTWSYLRMRKLDVPKSYVNSFVLRCIIYFSGVTIFIFMMIKRFATSYRLGERIVLA